MNWNRKTGKTKPNPYPQRWRVLQETRHTKKSVGASKVIAHPFQREKAFSWTSMIRNPELGRWAKVDHFWCTECRFDETNLISLMVINWPNTDETCNWSCSTLCSLWSWLGKTPASALKGRLWHLKMKQSAYHPGNRSVEYLREIN